MTDDVRAGERVLVVDDDPSFRELTRSLLGQAGLDVREAATGEEALEAARAAPPVLVLLDIRLPGLSGYEVCRELRKEFGDRVAIVFVSGERVESYDRVAGLLVGADDYLVKPLAPDELIERVRTLLRRLRNGAPSPQTLTQRELQVLRLLAEGLPQEEIARQLVISPKTVGKHIEHILTKLGVHSRTHAVARAYRENLL